MELRNLTTFVRAAELRSFSQTARQLGYSQSAISMQISQLEAELETCLFDRVGKTVTLTPQGLRFFEYAQNILRMTENARSVMKNASLISGQLRVAMAESVCMSIFPRVLERYCRLYPEVQLSVISGTAVDLPRALAQNDADLVYQLDEPIYRSDLVVPISCPEPIVFIAPVGHPLTRRARVELADCAAEPFILTEKGLSYRQRLDTLLAREGLQITPFLEISNTDVIVRLVKGGMGLSFLPEFVARDALQRGDVARLDVAGADVALCRQLIYHRGKWITPAMQAMIDLICQENEGEPRLSTEA